NDGEKSFFCKHEQRSNHKRRPKNTENFSALDASVVTSVFSRREPLNRRSLHGRNYTLARSVFPHRGNTGCSISRLRAPRSCRRDERIHEYRTLFSPLLFATSSWMQPFSSAEP